MAIGDDPEDCHLTFQQLNEKYPKVARKQAASVYRFIGRYLLQESRCEFVDEVLKQTNPLLFLMPYLNAALVVLAYKNEFNDGKYPSKLIGQTLIHMTVEEYYIRTVRKYIPEYVDEACQKAADWFNKQRKDPDAYAKLHRKFRYCLSRVPQSQY